MSISHHILITHEKGGTAKTTTAVNLAHALTLEGKSVLLVDMDTRGDVAVALNTPCNNTVKKYVVGYFNDTPLEMYATPTPYLGLSAMTTDALGLDQTLRYLANEIDVERRLTDALAGLSFGYDYVVYDTSAASGVLRRAALDICDTLVIPSKLESLGIADIAVIVDQLPHRNYLIVPTIYDKRASIYCHNLRAIEGAYGERVMKPIPYRAVVNEASQAQRTLFDYAPNSDAAEAYRELALTVKEAAHG